MNNNKFIMAAAGSGKTSLLVEEALKIKTEKVLITTYTRANESEIKNKIIEKNKYIPENITVQTWFSFLLKHGVRPFQGVAYPELMDKRIKGTLFTNEQSAKFIKETKIEHYIAGDFKIYSDKLSKFTIKCNKNSGGNVIDRISKIYSYIFIDEVQDLSADDLELLKLFFSSKSSVLLVGDPRQGTFSTSNAPKNKQYKRSKIINFFQDKTVSRQVTTDDASLTINYRCIKPICDLSNKLFFDMQNATSGNNKTTGHDGVFLVKRQYLETYLQRYDPMQLRDSKRTPVNENYRLMNFGESKGCSFDRVLIYPTNPILKWLKNNDSTLADISRSKSYVAITRARYSVGIVVDDDEQAVIDGITYFNPV